MRALLKDAASALTMAALFELLALGLFVAMIVTVDAAAIAGMWGFL